MTAGFNIAPPHWHEPSNSKGLGIAEAVVADLKGTDMNAAFKADAKEYLRAHPTVVGYARELYEAALVADADWDSARTPYRLQRLEKAWEDMQRVMGK